MQITKISIQRSTMVVVLFTVLTLLGIFSYTQLSYELLPKMETNVVTISTVYPGAAPTEVETSVTKKIEDAVASLEGIKSMNSISQESISIITIELEAGEDVDYSLQDAQRKINAILGDLPDDADPPSLGKFDLDDLPIMQLAVYSNLNPSEFYDLVKNKIQPSLAQIKGVAQVNMLGGTEREIKVNLDRNKLDAYGISPISVAQTINASNLDFPTGRLKDNEGQVLIRLAGKFQNIQDIENLVIAYRNDESPIQLKEVAEVQDSFKDEEILTRLNGKSAIGLTVQKQSDANAVEVSEVLEQELQILEQTYTAEGVSFQISQNTSEFTLEAANHVITDLVIAVVLVALIMLLFLHSIRNAIIVMVAVPASIVATFTVMFLAGFTLNLMSLLALSLVVGILVDDAIVVIENIYRHLEMGKNIAQASYDGIREIGATVVSITLVIVVVFVPLAMTGGLISGILTQFSITVAAATLISLLVAFTLIPLLTSRFSKLEHLDKDSFFGKIVYGFEAGLDAFVDWLIGILRWGFAHKIALLGITLVLFISSFFLVIKGFIGSEFVSEGDRGEFLLRLELPKDATLEQTNFKTREVEDYLRTLPEVTEVFTTVGVTSGQFTGSQSSSFTSEILVKLVGPEHRSMTGPDYARQLENYLEENITGAEYTGVPISIMGTANDAPIQVIVSGPDKDSIRIVSEKIEGILAGLKGTRKIESSLEDGNPEIRVEVDRYKMNELGLSMDMVGGALQVAFNGNDDSKYTDGDYEYDILVKLNEFDRKSISDVQNLTFLNRSGQLVKLEQFATVNQSEGPTKLERRDRVSSVKITSQVAGVPSGTVGAELTAAIEAMDLPQQVQINYDGDMKNQAEGFGSLGIALLASIILIYLIMVALYDSYVYPLVVMFSLPMALIGSLLALALTKGTLSIFSIMGLIMLMGLVAKNAILLVDFTNQLKAEGVEVKTALEKAVKIRFRPILMTTIAMVIGMMPIALATGAGAEWKNSLAWVIIGGLLSSMFLTLVVVPVIYYLFDRFMFKIGKSEKKQIELEETDVEEFESEAAAYV
ncbi:efflux RND transporter permease subunit [Algoriphagus halophytocola]|uniref:Efflux RND transporter permease subunit n=1 Tax=Algoriphagus halophytocola TaxID=2991499 RepID=A0ABY6MLV4_9BACT|nr:MULTISPECIES: efflux RND transporter permease subunit [unclassified Algoriphagus]UZD23362.1 efflux RND transporter permease subunit [Algoriphagus sp. TR-M5]WBL44657.1 efflux RND transporter permease subunit [Algoriphagus sp. TR-M9]